MNPIPHPQNIRSECEVMILVDIMAVFRSPRLPGLRASAAPAGVAALGSLKRLLKPWVSVSRFIDQQRSRSALLVMSTRMMHVNKRVQFATRCEHIPRDPRHRSEAQPSPCPNPLSRSCLSSALSSALIGSSHKDSISSYWVMLPP